MALIKCPKCGARIPDNAKFCQECGCDVLKGLQIKERQQRLAEMNAPTYNNSEIENTEVPMPQLSTIFGSGIASIVCLGFLIFSVQFSVFFSIISGVLLLIFSVTFFATIQDYNLAKTDFEKYKAKTLKEQKQAKESKDAYNAQREQERKREEEKQAAIYARRSEYSAKGLPSCPKCGSPAIATVNRGYSLVWGFIGSGKPVNVCQKCGYKWKI